VGAMAGHHSLLYTEWSAFLTPSAFSFVEATFP